MLRSVVVVGCLSLVGCVLFVKEETYATHCGFAGADLPCGDCLRNRCQEPIDACCDDAACADTLRRLDRCARRDPGGCEDLGAIRDSASVDGSLARCAATRCGAVCQTFVGTSDTTCKEPAFARGETCACTSAPSAGNDFECSPQGYPGTICCAPQAWPAPGLECTCRALSCYPTADGCLCRILDTPPQHAECSSPPCCVSKSDPEQCACRQNCYENERPVPTCADVGTGRVVGCGNGQKEVASCSARRP